MTSAIGNSKYYVIAYGGVQEGKIVTGFVNPKLGRFVCTNIVQWGTYDWREAVSLASLYSYQASQANEICSYSHHEIVGEIPNVQYYFITSKGK